MIHEKYLGPPGRQTAYAQCGEGAPVVFVHGALADQRLWYPHMELVANNESLCLAPTLRNFGRTPTMTGNFGINTHATDLAEFIRALTDCKVRLVAWSYGADVALAAAVQHPELLEHVFLYEPGFPGYLAAADLELFMSDAQAMFQNVFKHVQQGELEQAVACLIDGSGGAPGYFRTQAAEAIREQLDNAHTLPLQLHQSEEPPLSEATLREIQVPVTLAHGENTRCIFSVVTKTAARLIPRSELVLVPAAGHMLPVEDPARFAALSRR